MISRLAAALLAATIQPPLPQPPPSDAVFGLPLVEKVLTALSEPKLSTVEQPEKVVRIVMIPAFTQTRLVVSRLTRRADHVEVVTKTMVDWMPGAGKITIFPTTRLQRSRWKEIDEAMTSGLWRFRPGPFPDPRVADGELWFVEASGPRGHIAVIQDSPEDNPFRELCRRLMWASGIDFTQREFVSWFAGR